MKTPFSDEAAALSVDAEREKKFLSNSDRSRLPSPSGPISGLVQTPVKLFDIVRVQRTGRPSVKRVRPTDSLNPPPTTRDAPPTAQVRSSYFVAVRQARATSKLTPSTPNGFAVNSQRVRTSSILPFHFSLFPFSLRQRAEPFRIAAFRNEFLERRRIDIMWCFFETVGLEIQDQPDCLR